MPKKPRSRSPNDRKGTLIRVKEFASVKLAWIPSSTEEGPCLLTLDLVVCKDVRAPGPWTRAVTSPAMMLKQPNAKARLDTERCALCLSLLGELAGWQCLAGGTASVARSGPLPFEVAVLETTTQKIRNNLRNRSSCSRRPRCSQSRWMRILSSKH